MNSERSTQQDDHPSDKVIHETKAAIEKLQNDLERLKALLEMSFEIREENKRN